MGDDVTEYLFGWVTDLHGEGWLVANDQYSMKIHPAAVMDKINVLLQPWIDAGTLPDDTLAVLAATVEDHKASGEPLNVYGAFPQYFKDISKDRAAMITEGYLSNDPTLPPPIPAARKR